MITGYGEPHKMNTMENNKIISNYIAALGDDAKFVGKADERQIKTIEKELEVTLSDSYKKFLLEYGLAVLPGFIILGCGLSTIPACVEYTLDWRNYGLPKTLVVIEDEGTDWIYCLDTSELENGECQVVDWEQNIGIEQKRYNSFMDFFRDNFKESISLK